MATHWAYWLPIVTLLITSLITWLVTKYKYANGKVNVLVKVFLFLRELSNELREVTSDGNLSTDEIISALTTSLLKLQEILGEIQETFNVGDTTKLNNTKTEILGEGKITWKDTETILSVKKAKNSKIRAVKGKLESIKLKKQ